MLYADVTRLLYRHLTNLTHTGIDRVNLEYARWVVARDGSLCAKRGTRLMELPLDPWIRLLVEGIQPGNKANTLLRRFTLLLRWWATQRPLPSDATVLVSTHSWLGKKKTWEWVKSRRIHAVVFIHDLIPIDFPEYQRPEEKAFHEARMRLTLKHATALIVNSRCTASAIGRFAAREHLPIPPVLVAPLGHNLPPPAHTALPDGLRPHYFVSLGTIEPRKNHLLLLALWREMAKKAPDAVPQLVVVGRRGWECEQVVDMLERCEAIHPHLLEINNASDEQVVSLLEGARALLMPSFAEGFGMPVQEALAVGTPVISSPLPAIREFAVDIPDYAEPHDGVRWLELIEDYNRDRSELRAAQLERLKRFKDTSWPEHFALVEDFLAKNSRTRPFGSPKV